jgi:hypothetical protein
MTHDVFLFFQNPETFLGELSTEKGRFIGIKLTEAGEPVLGDHADSWREGGSFPEAIPQWAEAHKLMCLALTNHIQAACWHTILRLPFTPALQFEMVNGIAHADADMLVAWQQFLAEADATVQKGTQKANAEIQKLQDAAVKNLLKKVKK